MLCRTTPWILLLHPGIPIPNCPLTFVNNISWRGFPFHSPNKQWKRVVLFVYCAICFKLDFVFIILKYVVILIWDYDKLNLVIQLYIWILVVAYSCDKSFSSCNIITVWLKISYNIEVLLVKRKLKSDLYILNNIDGKHSKNGFYSKFRQFYHAGT